MTSDRVARTRRDVPVSVLLLCLRAILDLPPTSEDDSGASVSRYRSALTLDLEGWLAFVLLALPMFSGELPAALAAALPHSRRLLLGLAMQHAGDDGPEVGAKIAKSRRELRRLLAAAGLPVDASERSGTQRRQPQAGETSEG